MSELRQGQAGSHSYTVFMVLGTLYAPHRILVIRTLYAPLFLFFALLHRIFGSTHSLSKVLSYQYTLEYAPPFL